MMLGNIGLTFDLNENWIGGSYYIRNLIAAMGMLPGDEQPIITLLSAKPESVRFAAETGYRRLGWVRAEDFNANPDRFPLDALFPWAPTSQAWRTVSWIPDFQELHLPYYCSPGEIDNRRYHHRLRFATAGLVVSSEDVRRDVATFYPGECPDVAVVHFATFDRFDATCLPDVKAAYGIKGRYIMCANQVWVHKNHIAVMKAVALLMARGLDVNVIFTGNESDYRIAGYGGFLRQLAQEWNLGERVRFLGFIPRDHQLNLMKGADYVIQPSLFEGWSTVIEDAKAMNQFVVASDLDVHKEQLPLNGRFFPRRDPRALATIMQEFRRDPPRPVPAGDYDAARRRFARDFIAAMTAFVPRDRPVRAPAAMLSAEEMATMSAANMSSLGLAPS